MAVEQCQSKPPEQEWIAHGLLGAIGKPVQKYPILRVLPEQSLLPLAYYWTLSVSWLRLPHQLSVT